MLCTFTISFHVTFVIYSCSVSDCFCLLYISAHISHCFQCYWCFTVLPDQKLANNHSSFLSYRLEDQTKKLHKDMKKSTEADLGVFCHQPMCYHRVCHWSPLVHQHTWCCLAGFSGLERHLIVLVCLVLCQLSVRLDKWDESAILGLNLLYVFLGYYSASVSFCAMFSKGSICLPSLPSCICRPQKPCLLYFLFAYLLVLELCIWEAAVDMACGK